MIEILSRHISKEIKRSSPESTVSLEVLEYAIGIRLNFIATMVLTITCGLLTGKLYETIIAFVAFAVARYFSGGYHFRSLTLCAIVSALVFASIPLIPVPQEYTVFITLIATLIFILYSPNIMEELNRSRLDPYLKPISIFIVMSNFVIHSPILALAFLAQAISIIPWKGVERDE
jgi:accessory gene regulator B